MEVYILPGLDSCLNNLKIEIFSINKHQISNIKYQIFGIGNASTDTIF